MRRYTLGRRFPFLIGQLSSTSFECCILSTYKAHQVIFYKHLAIMFETSNCILVVQISLPNEEMHFFGLAVLFYSMLFKE